MVNLVREILKKQHYHALRFFIFIFIKIRKCCNKLHTNEAHMGLKVKKIYLKSSILCAHSNYLTGRSFGISFNLPMAKRSERFG